MSTAPKPMLHQCYFETRGALREVLIRRQMNRCSRKVYAFVGYTFCERTLDVIETKMSERMKKAEYDLHQKFI